MLIDMMLDAHLQWIETPNNPYAQNSVNLFPSELGMNALEWLYNIFVFYFFHLQ